MYPKILHFIQNLEKEFETIPDSRKKLLQNISRFIAEKLSHKKPIQLMYVCTHNSRRSHLGQIWAKVAADYYNINNVSTYSGGTEITAFNINAINALKRLGFIIKPKAEAVNTEYEVMHSDENQPSICYSKLFSDLKNPQKEFAAIMTCSDAEENCPFISGVELRIATTYHDPKNFDNTPLQDQMYDERCRQIALETCYVFNYVAIIKE
jgi:protein-tyrosine phosphatase/arsenate reductase